MKRNEFVQIKGLDLQELRLKGKALREEIANLIFDKNMKKLKDLKMIAKKKKELAQILTVIRQKELLKELEVRIQQDNSNESVIASKAKQSLKLKKIAASSTTKVGTPRNDNDKRSKKYDR